MLKDVEYFIGFENDMNISSISQKFRNIHKIPKLSLVTYIDITKFSAPLIRK